MDTHNYALLGDGYDIGQLQSSSAWHTMPIPTTLSATQHSVKCSTGVVRLFAGNWKRSSKCASLHRCG